MWFLRWLHGFFFLDKLQFPVLGKEKIDYFFEKETNFLVERLSADYNIKITYDFDFTNNTVVIKTPTETFAVLYFRLKRNGLPINFLVVELERRFDQSRAWFQLAFVGFKVSFKRPVLLIEYKAPREL